MQIAAVVEAGQDLLFHRAGEVAAGLEFLVVLARAMMQRARSRVTRAIEATAGGACILGAYSRSLAQCGAERRQNSGGRIRDPGLGWQ